MVITVVPIVHKTGTYGKAFFPRGAIWTKLTGQDLGMPTDAAWPLLRVGRRHCGLLQGAPPSVENLGLILSRG